jgi:hypothetical protein
MKFSPARALAISILTILLDIPVCSAQSTQPEPNPSAGQATAPSPQSPAKPSGQVIFQRSIDENGETVTKTGPAAKPTAQTASAPSVEDVDRQSVTFTDLDLDVHLNTAAQQLSARAQLTVRNTGKIPLTRIPLQISSSLNWERIRIPGREVSFPVATLNSDSDHAGQLHEAAVPLAQPLATGATVQLDVSYSGTITASTQRLLAIGTPEDTARHSDWDEISTSFTGLRGFGNVVWYPVSSVPVILGDGARLYDEIGTQKLRLSGARFRLRLTVEFPHGQPPSIALVNGHPLALTISDPPGANPDVSGVATGTTDSTTLGFESPSLFVATRTPHPGPNLTAYTVPENGLAMKSWLAAVTTVAPFLQRWLGPQPRTQLTLLDPPDPDDAPWEAGPLLVVSLRDAAPDQLQSILAHAFTHAWMAPSPFWLNEGAANFMGTLYAERLRGRDHALATLEDGRSALAFAEPASPGAGAGQPLALAISPVYYRTKAAYVLWMLRDLVGDDTLGAALRAHNAAPEAGSDPPSLQKALQQTAPRIDLSWFFADWVDADKGLPDLTIDKVFPNAAQSGNWLVSVSISNAGYAAANVPVIVRSATNTSADRVLVPAHGTVTQRILIQGRPAEVQVNDGAVPETQASVHITRLDQPQPNPPSPSPTK